MNLSPRTRTRLLVTAVLSAAIVTLGASLPVSINGRLWFWLGACIAGEAMWVRLPLGGATLSMASCFNFAALLVLPRGEAMVVTALATLVAELFVMRKPLTRAAYNAGHTSLAVAAGAWVFVALGGEGRSLVTLVSSLRLDALIAPALVYYAINRGAVVLAVASSEGIAPAAAWRRNFSNAYEALSSGAVFSLGALLGTHYQGIGMVGTLLVALPLMLACDGLRRATERSAREVAAPPASDSDRRAA